MTKTIRIFFEGTAIALLGLVLTCLTVSLGSWWVMLFKSLELYNETWFLNFLWFIYLVALYLITIPILKKKLTPVLTVPCYIATLALTYTTIWSMTEPWLPTIYAIVFIITLAIIYFLIKKRKTWHYYFATLLTTIFLSVVFAGLEQMLS